MTESMKTNLREIAQQIERRAHELNARASFIADKEKHGGASDFDLEMLRDSASSVAFWVDEMLKAVVE